MSLIIPAIILSQVAPNSAQIAAFEQFNRSHENKWTIRWDKETGAPAFLFGYKTKPYKGSPESIARKFLNKNRTIFKMKSSLPHLVLERVRKSKRVTHIRFGQVYEGLPVYSGEYFVHLDSNNCVQMTNGRYFPDIEVDTRPAIAKDKAIEYALSFVELIGSLSEPASAELMVYPKDGQFSLVWRVLLPNEPFAAWECIVNAMNGDVLSCDDMLLHVDGLGNVYPIDPVNSALTPVLIHRLNAPGYYLDGTYVKTLNYSGPEAFSVKRDFRYSPPPYDEFDDTHFDEVNVYWHIDKFAYEYWPSIMYPGLGYKIEADVHIEDFDNAGYGVDGRLHFGMGETNYWDLSKKDDVIYHEYTHAVCIEIGLERGHENSQTRAMQEGYADYFAASYTNDHIIGEWVTKLSCCDHIRTLQSDPEDYNYSNYSDPPEYPVPQNPYDELQYRRSMIWSGALWDLRETLPDPWDADLIIYQGLEYVNGLATFEGGRYGIIQADLYWHNGENQNVIKDVFDTRGILDTGPSAPEGLTLSGTVGQNPRLGWDANTEPDVVKYWIYRKRDGIDNSYKYIATVYAPSTTYTDYTITISAGGNYVWYVIKAVDWINQSSDYSNTVSTKYQQGGPSKLLVSEQMPKDFELKDNYPNPFNPITTIHYALPEESLVLLKVYNLAGKELKTLVSRNEVAGYKSVQWDGKDSFGNPVSSGMYFYQIKAISLESESIYHETRKMVLLR